MANESPVPAEAKAPDATEQRLAALERKLKVLENHAHDVGPDVTNEIAEHAFQRVLEHLRKAFGHSGLPAV